MGKRSPIFHPKETKAYSKLIPTSWEGPTDVCSMKNGFPCPWKTSELHGKAQITQGKRRKKRRCLSGWLPAIPPQQMTAYHVVKDTHRGLMRKWNYWIEGPTGANHNQWPRLLCGGIKIRKKRETHKNWFLQQRKNWFQARRRPSWYDDVEPGSATFDVDRWLFLRHCTTTCASI